MRDLAGFALLLAVLALATYVLFFWVLPFVAMYLLGMTLFFGVAVVALRRGRLHPQHLECLLKPGVPGFLFLAALLLPGAHAAMLLLTDAADLWPWVLGLNLLPTLAWTARMLWWHREQRPLYALEGHDLEDLLDRVQTRDAALEVRLDALDWAGAPRPAPEDWERIAGDWSPAPDLGTEAESLRADLERMRSECGRLAATLHQALDEVRAGTVRPPHPALASVAAALDDLDRRATEIGSRESGLLGEQGQPQDRWSAA